MIGQKFGKLTVIGQHPVAKDYFYCHCDCGKTKEKPIRKDHLIYGRTVSCGCERSRKSSERAHLMHEANRTHGLSNTPAHQVWMGMKHRCKYHPRYAGRRIMVCNRWANSFENFLSDMGSPGPKMTIERIDNNGPYSPENCRWATRREQGNNREVNRLLIFEGRTLTIKQWSDLTGIHRNTLYQRLDEGLSPAEILSPEKRRNLEGLKLGGLANGARNAAKTHCKWGHPFDEVNTYWTAKGGRVCKECRAATMRRITAARRATMG